MEPVLLSVLAPQFINVQFARKDGYLPHVAGSILACLRHLSGGQAVLNTSFAEVAHALDRNPRTVRSYIGRFGELGLIEVIEQHSEGITIRLREVKEDGSLTDLVDTAIETWHLAGRSGLPALSQNFLWRHRNDDDID